MRRMREKKMNRKSHRDLKSYKSLKSTESKGKYITLITGILILAIGLYFIKTLEDPQGVMRTLPYILVGLGSGLFGHGMGEIISDRVLHNSPEVKRQMDITHNDERNITIQNMAKSKAFDMMTFVLAALMLSFALMQVDLKITLLLVFVYLIIHGVALYYRIKLDKEM